MKLWNLYTEIWRAFPTNTAYHVLFFLLWNKPMTLTTRLYHTLCSNQWSYLESFLLYLQHRSCKQQALFELFWDEWYVKTWTKIQWIHGFRFIWQQLTVCPTKYYVAQRQFTLDKSLQFLGALNLSSVVDRIQERLMCLMYNAILPESLRSCL